MAGEEPWYTDRGWQDNYFPGSCSLQMGGEAKADLQQLTSLPAVLGLQQDLHEVFM